MYNVRLQYIPGGQQRKYILYIEDAFGLISNVVAQTPQELLDLAKRIEYAATQKMDSMGEEGKQTLP
jgi:hypothetical protein